MFVAMGLSAVLPILHGMQLYGLATLTHTIGLHWVVLQGMLYIVGAGLYAVRTPLLYQPLSPATLNPLPIANHTPQARFPERACPGAFDIWGSSHQLFHALVVLAAAVHLVGLVTAFDNAHSGRAAPRPLGVLPTTWL
jgi:adiponectin receptor